MFSNQEMGLAKQMDDLKLVISKFIDKTASELRQLSQEIWSHPELSGMEYKAHQYLSGFLERAGFSVQKKYILETGFRATFTKGNYCDGPRIAFLCEYDALPVIGHACGHNLIAEVGIGAGLAVKAALEKSDISSGTVIIFGTPAEEGDGGKVDFVNAGAFDDVDVALISHPAHFSASKNIFSSMQEGEVTYLGKESHSASNPWDGVNALDAAVLAYSSISCLRQQIHQCSRIHAIITKGGDAVNIVPKETKLSCCVRASTHERLVDLTSKVEACLKAAAIATGCQVICKWNPRVFLPVHSERHLLEIYEKNAKKLGTQFTDNEEFLTLPTGSTDMGNVSYVVPSLHPHFNIGGTSKEHTIGFASQAGKLFMPASSEAQLATLKEAKTLAYVAAELFCQPELVHKIKKEFDDSSIHVNSRNLQK